jgi:hypothetical protein
MIQLTTADTAKIALLDKILSAMTIQQLTDLAGQDLVASKLRDDTGSEFIMDLVRNANSMEADLMSAKMEVDMLKADLRTIIEALYKPYDPSASMNFSNLKNRYSVY